MKLFLNFKFRIRFGSEPKESKEDENPDQNRKLSAISAFEFTEEDEVHLGTASQDEIVPAGNSKSELKKNMSCTDLAPNSEFLLKMTTTYFNLVHRNLDFCSRSNLAPKTDTSKHIATVEAVESGSGQSNRDEKF